MKKPELGQTPPPFGIEFGIAVDQIVGRQLALVERLSLPVEHAD